MAGVRGRGYEVLGIRELTAEDVKGLKRAKLPAVRKLRAIHHRVATLLAAGWSQTHVAEVLGYSASRICVLAADPAFRNLMATLQGQLNARDIDALSEASRNINGVNSLSWQIIRDRLEDAVEQGTEDDIPWAVLLKAAGDSADRVGLAKRSVALNVNVDFASQLQKAVQRSRLKVIEHSPPAAPASPPTLLGDALAGASGNGKEAPIASPRPVLIHEAPLMRPAPVESRGAIRPTQPGLVTRRTA